MIYNSRYIETFEISLYKAQNKQKRHFFEHFWLSEGYIFILEHP